MSSSALASHILFIYHRVCLYCHLCLGNVEANGDHAIEIKQREANQGPRIKNDIA